MRHRWLIISWVAVTNPIFRGQKGRRAGESHPRATHTDGEVLRVRDLHESGMGYKRIAQLLGLPWSWVRDIAAFRRRPFVPVRSWPEQGSGAAEQLR